MKRYIFISTSLLLLLVLIPGCFTFQTPPAATTPPVGTTNTPWANTVRPVSVPNPVTGSSAVTSVVANTEPRSSTGCMNLFANITANGPCTVSYLWESLDGGGYSYTWDITIPEAGTQKIKLPVEMSALPSGNYQLHVVAPNDVVSNSTYYKTCQ